MYWNDPIAWSPFDELRSLQRDMNRLFDGLDGGTAMSRFPALNVWGSEEQVVVTAELPGLNPDEIDISVVDNQLTIKGERKDDRPSEDAVCHRCERDTGRFVRTVRLPYSVENDRVSARYENGILCIYMPRHEATKPKRIEIKAS
ncbi:Hsp20/alpha crystallin family protein [Verrucomicrobia bacterium S94]|nr:Hsp20/alpha crystallin family protein [Verrucomicrobia bacterium S94]